MMKISVVSLYLRQSHMYFLGYRSMLLIFTMEANTNFPYEFSAIKVVFFFSSKFTEPQNSIHEHLGYVCREIGSVNFRF